MLYTVYLLGFTLLLTSLQGAEDTSLEQIKTKAASESKYLSTTPVAANEGPPEADLEGFTSHIEPILADSCLQCHGPDRQRGDFRIDTLDPDLVRGKDADWWLEVIEVMSNGEMPPPDKDVEITEENRGKVIDWLSTQVLAASQVERSEGGHSSFRRMTRYELNYALQDLLGVHQDLAIDLPPETASEEGFQNSSEILQMTSQQFGTYQEIARTALKAATVNHSRPKELYFAMTMDKAGDYYEDWINDSIESLKLRKKSNPELNYEGPWKFIRLRKGMSSNRYSKERAHFYNKETGEGWNRSFPYGYSIWEPTDQKPVDPEVLPFVMVLPSKTQQVIDLGNYLPDRGLVKIRFRASRASNEGGNYPSLRLSFGYKPGNNSSHDYVISKEDIAITASPDQPEFYEWIISMDGISRNPFLRTKLLGMNPNSSEHITIKNVHQGEKSEGASVHIDYIEVTTPLLDEWPPESHQRLFPKEAQTDDELENARIILANFMPKAWRRPITKEEIEQRITLFQTIRPTFDDFQETMVEVLATVLSSPHFLYITRSNESITDSELAARLSFFLWSSQPDDELLKIVSDGNIRDPKILAEQVERLLASPRSKRFVSNFTHQWLDMDLLHLLEIDKKVYPKFSKELKQSMQQEPVAFFQHILNENRSIMDFLHADYALLNQRLAKYYGVDEVFGNHFRKVDLPPGSKRGGLLVQAGLLAMNSDGIDSHPLKRGIWLLESILNDPPPPAPPAVPEIDLTDPAILKMTLKERIEDHRNKPACASCHSKIDPWGIAFEEFDAIGAWRSEIDGKPVDATSQLYNESALAGMDGLKRYLLANRQDQFSSAMVHKLASYSLGRPLSFSDHAELERITKELRQNDDGLRSLIHLLVTSKLFQTK